MRIIFLTRELEVIGIQRELQLQTARNNNCIIPSIKFKYYNYIQDIYFKNNTLAPSQQLSTV